MGKYAVHRVDANAEPLFEFLEAHGVTVKKTPGGPLDVVLSLSGATALADVKSATGKLRPGQAKFLRDWPGLTAVLRTEADCLELIWLLRQMARNR